jgi:hypothetical protein
MKNLKLIYVSIILVMFAMTSCTNDDSIIQQEATTKSLSAKSSMQELSYHFNDDGTLTQNDGTTDNNPIGNILFDFCFEFEYPVTLSYNSGATVVINDFDALVDVLINMTDNLYIDGIAFPFNVFVFNPNSGAVEVQTINTENDFVTLIESCGFDEDDCVYTDDFDPICIEIQDFMGESFIIQFPNMSYAICEGFTQNDVVVCDEIVDPGVDDNECFEFDYPISIVTLAGSTIEVSSDEEWETIMFTIQGFDFVYPFNVILLNGDTTQTIANDNDFISLLDTCYDFDPIDPCNCTDEYAPVCVESDGFVITYNNFCLAQCEGYTQADIVDCGTSQGDCSISNVEVTIGDCNDDSTYSLTLNFNYEITGGDYGFTLYDVNQQVIGQSVYSFDDLPLTINLNENISPFIYIVADSDNGGCSSFVEWFLPNCDGSGTSDCWEFVYPVDIEVNGVTQTINSNTELDVIITDPSVQYQPVYPFSITINQVAQQIDTPNNFWEIGEWESMCD